MDGRDTLNSCRTDSRVVSRKVDRNRTNSCGAAGCKVGRIRVDHSKMDSAMENSRMDDVKMTAKSITKKTIIIKIKVKRKLKIIKIGLKSSRPTFNFNLISI